MAREVGEAAGGRDPPEPRHVRMGRAVDEQQHGEDGGHENSLQNPEEEHTSEGGEGDREFHPAERPHAAKLGHVDQARDGHEHDRGQDDLGEGAQESREEQEADRDGQRREDQGERRPAPALSLTVDCERPPATG